MFDAIANGRLDDVKFIHENGYKLNESTFAWAALCGQLHIIKWLNNEGCPFDEYTHISAAKSCDLEIIEYMHDLSCPCRIPVYINSIRENEETLELVKMINCEVLNESMALFKDLD